jgi:Amino acid kinase family
VRIVIALGGNALLRRDHPVTMQVQRRNVRIAAEAIAPLSAGHSTVIVHGNGPQVGLLSLQAEAHKGDEPYPLDVLDAGTQGMIGYLIQQELRSLLPPDSQVVTLLTMVAVDADDPEPTLGRAGYWLMTIGSAVALVIFTLITSAHLRIRAETGASLLILILAFVAADAVLVTFVFTTLIHEPASIVTLLAILVLSIGLDYGWKRGHHPSSPVHAQVGHQVSEVLR